MLARTKENRSTNNTEEERAANLVGASVSKSPNDRNVGGIPFIQRDGLHLGRKNIRKCAVWWHEEQRKHQTGRVTSYIEAQQADKRVCKPADLGDVRSQRAMDAAALSTDEHAQIHTAPFGGLLAAVGTHPGGCR